MLIHTVLFAVITLIYAAANTIHRGYVDSQIFNQPHSIQANEISNRVRRNAFDIPNFSQIADNTAIKIRRNVFQNVMSALPNENKIKDLLTVQRTKRSFYDYDSSDNQEDIELKTQLEQIASRHFAPNARNEDQQRKIFFSRIFSMIDDEKNSSTPKTNCNGVKTDEKDFSGTGDVSFANERYNYEDFLNDDVDQSSEFLKSDVEELFSDKLEAHKTGKFDNLNEFDLKKNIYVPMRKNKKRREAQDDSFPPKPQVSESINDDSSYKHINEHSNPEDLISEKKPNVPMRKIKKRREAQDDSFPPKRPLSESINDNMNHKQINEHSNPEYLVSEKKPNEPMGKLKKRQEAEDTSFHSNVENAQDDSFPQTSMNGKINSRLERQLGELINDDNTHKEFYKYSEIDSGANEEYEDIEPPMDQQLPYGPTEDDAVQNSSADIYLTTTDVNISSHESNEGIDDNSSSISLESSPSTVIPQSSISYTTPTNIDVTKKHRKISSKYNLNSPESTQNTTNTVFSFKIKTTEQTPTTSSSYTSHENIVENINKVKNFDSNSKVNNEVNEANLLDNNSAGHNQSPKVLYEDENNAEKISSRRTNSNSGKENVERKQKVADSSKTKNDGTSLTSDIKVARVYDEAEVTTDKNNIIENPLAARIKLDFLIQLQTPGNNEFRIYRVS